MSTGEHSSASYVYLSLDRMGNSEFTNYAGGLRDLRIWSIARSASAAAADYNTMLSGAEANLTAYWLGNQNQSLRAQQCSHAGR